MLDDVLPTEARDEVTALRFTCIHSEGLMDGLEGGEPDGRRRRKQAVRPTTGEQAHRQKHGRTERWTDQRKLK